MFPGNPRNVNEMYPDDRVPQGTFEMDERQLSSEIERLVLGNNPEFYLRGNDGQPKKEPTQEPCMFPRSNVNPFGTLQHQVPSGPPLNYGGVHGEVTQPWPPTISQGTSLSSIDLSMDRDASMPPSFTNLTPMSHYVKPEPVQPLACQGQQYSGTGEVPFRRMKYPHDDNLAVYGIENCDVSLEPETEHRRWQQTQSNSQPSSVETNSMPEMMEAENVPHEFEQDENGEGPLHWLSQVTDKGVMAKIIDTLQRCNVVTQCINHQNKHKQTPLFLAVQASNIPLVGWLLLNHADPNIQGTLYTDRDEYMWRAPLHLAVGMGDAGLSMVRLLLAKSPLIDINIRSLGDKLTPLHLALMCHSENHSCQQIVNELLDHKADITIREQSSSKTPFILAIQTRDIPLIQGFLEKFPADKRRAILQDQTRSGDTCLHIAAGMSRFPSHQKELLLRYLVTQGANGNIPNNVKELPRDFARTEWDRIKNF